MSVNKSDFFELHFLPFGSVVEAEFDEHKIKLMIVDWSVHDDENHYDYLGCPWPRGFVGGETEDDTVIKIPFSADSITGVFFFGPTDEGFAQRDSRAFEIARENNQEIAKLFEEGELSTLKIRRSNEVAEKRELGIITREGTSSDLFPVGTVAVIEVNNAEGEPQDVEVMITSLVPNHRGSDFDYEVMAHRAGYCAFENTRAIKESEIKKIKSLGFINAEVQLLVNSENVKKLRGE